MKLLFQLTILQFKILNSLRLYQNKITIFEVSLERDYLHLDILKVLVFLKEIVLIFSIFCFICLCFEVLL
jgi:hypothetical protein